MNSDTQYTVFKIGAAAYDIPRESALSTLRACAVTHVARAQGVRFYTLKVGGGAVCIRVKARKGEA